MGLIKKVIGECTLYLGDCEKVFPEIQKVNAVVTDPPYIYTGYTPGNKGFDEYEENIINTAKLIDGFDYCAVFAEFRRMMDLFNVYCFASNNQLPGIAQWGIDNKLQTYILTWNKLTGRPFGKTYLHNTEFIVHMKESGAVFNGAYTSRILECRSNRQYGHPTEKPLPLIDKLVLFASNQGDTIFDPYMGSGTTGVACARNGRKFIGVEKDEKYFEIACERIETICDPGLMRGGEGRSYYEHCGLTAGSLVKR